MNEETKNIELTEQELDQVAGGMRKAGAAAGNNKDNDTETKGAAPVAPVVRPIVGTRTAG